LAAPQGDFMVGTVVQTLAAGPLMFARHANTPVIGWVV
jgi:hypothetical protein